MNHSDTLAYARGVPNVFEKEIPRLVRMSGASAILSCERSTRLVICVLFFLECTTFKIGVKNLGHVMEH